MESNQEGMSIVEESDASQEKSDKNLVEDGELHEDEQISNKGDEEDIPDDFFDDFSNQDFMDGLDIVDAWDEKVKNKKLKEQKDKEEKRRDTKKSRDRKSRTPERDRRRRSTERRKRSRDRRHKENSPQKKKPADDVELRRDPSKTKRDLEKDRENYVKKKEQKFISKVVETGLVPPGMESEVNLSELEDKSKEVKDVTEKTKSKKETSKVEEQKINLQTENRDTIRDRRRRRSRSFERGSPIYRGRSNERKRERSRGRRDRSRERIRRSRERSFGRIRGVSPFSPSPLRRRRSRSLSERERWLKLRRSSSPERKYRERLGEEKMSFLEELKMKLDGFPNNHSNPEYNFPPNSGQPNFMQHGPVNNFPPQPMQMVPPVPNQYFPPNSNSPYDQNFFIGDSHRLPPSNHTPLHVQPQMHGLPAPVLPPSQRMPMHPSLLGEFGGSAQITGHALRPVPPPPVSTTGVNNVVKLMEQIKASTAMINQAGNATQLLEEKKLSLTDYLSMNSRPAAFSSHPEALQKKVNVLSRCQDILKELTGDKKFGGKLIVMKTSSSQEVEPQVKNLSPLLRKEPVKFSYSTPSKNAEKSTFQNILNRALIRAGVISLVIDLDDDEKSVESVPPPPKIGKQKSAPFGAKHVESPSKRVLMKMCQTDPIHCEDCEKRKAIQYKNIGIQCGETERYNVGVQVYEMDIINSKIPKNQSLAYLTPAQLLGRTDSTSTKVENFSNLYGKSAVPQPYRDWPRGYGDSDQRRIDFASPSYPGSAIRDPQRFPRY